MTAQPPPLCSRCSTPATVAMSYDYAAAKVWLDDAQDPFMPGRDYPLCEVHAASLTPPVGWTLTDSRSPVRPLFLSVDVA